MKSRSPSNKFAMLKSQRMLQKIQCEETATKATAQHDDLMETHDKSITDIVSHFTTGSHTILKLFDFS